MYVHYLAASADAASYTAMTAGRIGSLVGVGFGLIGVVIGGLALTRPAGRFGTDNRRLGVIAALVAGVIGMSVGGLVVAAADGGPGTGGGVIGGVVAALLGLIGVVLAGVALARFRRLA